MGAGYLGRRLSQVISTTEADAKVHLTSRTATDKIHFDLHDPKSWTNLPKVDMTFWTFPAEPLDIVQSFYTSSKDRLGTLVVVGTTGVLKPISEHDWVDETTVRSNIMDRTKGEDYLLSQGARLVLSAGIYGPNRNPMEWIRRGLVGPTEKYVNFIHVDDLSSIVLAAGTSGKSSKVYVAADGKPKSWKEIFTHLGMKALESDLAAKKITGRTSKRVSSSHTLQELEVHLKYEDIYTGLQSLK